MIELDVGGLRYVIKYDDLKKYPESFFEALLMKVWRQDNNHAQQ